MTVKGNEGEEKLFVSIEHRVTRGLRVLRTPSGGPSIYAATQISRLPPWPKETPRSWRWFTFQSRRPRTV